MSVSICIQPKWQFALQNMLIPLLMLSAGSLLATPNLLGLNYMATTLCRVLSPGWGILMLVVAVKLSH